MTAPTSLLPGPRNALTDVVGLSVGHYSASGDGYLTGTTVVLSSGDGMVAGVDVRGGGPGTRETDLLSPLAAVERVNGIVLTGGSAYGLAAACGVADALGDRGIGLQVGTEPGQVVPIVPAAVLFDLGRGGDFGARPDTSFGRAAVLAAAERPDGPEFGCLGAGTGAVCGGLKGAVGVASVVLPGGTTVAALIVVNAVGSPFDPATGELHGGRFLVPGDAPELHTPTSEDRDRLRSALANRPTAPRYAAGAEVPAAASAVRNTTIGVIATDAALTKAQCAKLAGIGHDGLARALNPVHTLFDGDTLFAVSTTAGAAPDLFGFQAILTVAADVVTRALVRGLLAARGVSTPGGSWSGYRELAPSALGRDPT